MNEIEIQREMLNKIIKQTIARIKKLQKQLEVEKKECSELGHYSDCGSFYQDAVTRTEAVISELISQKITLQKWRKKLKYEQNV
jgi:hypothetical protein